MRMKTYEFQISWKYFKKEELYVLRKTFVMSELARVYLVIVV